MPYEKFKDIMEELLSIKEDGENLQKAFKKFEPDFNDICFGRYETLVVKALKEAMNDKYDYIYYFLYDCNCGKDKDMNKKIKHNGKYIPFKTLKNLYDLINEENKTN